MAKAKKASEPQPVVVRDEIRCGRCGSYAPAYRGVPNIYKCPRCGWYGHKGKGGNDEPGRHC